MNQNPPDNTTTPRSAARIMSERVTTLENALKVLMGDVEHLGYWIPDPCRRLVDDALANDKDQPTQAIL